MMVGRSIGRFELEGEVAQGGSATVYHARDAASGERVALKLVHGLALAETHRFGREAKILAQVSHPGVVRYVEHGETEDGDAYLAMEWLEGEDLRRRLKRGPLSMHEVVTLGRRVAEALAAVHARGLVHRDIKPGNIFLPNGRVEDTKI